MASYSRTRSGSPFSHRKPASSCSSSNSNSSSSSYARAPRSGSSSSIAYMNSGNSVYGSRSTTTSRSCQDAAVHRSRNPASFAAEELLTAESLDGDRNAESISVTIRFRPLSNRELHRGDDIAWYADGDKIARNEYSPASAYAFDRVFGERTTTHEVYEAAAKPVVKAAMEGVNGTVFAYGVTSSGKTFTMHGDQNSPGIIPLAIKDVFSIIQDTPGREFLLRVSYLEIYNEVINDLLDPTGQNLRIREDPQGTYVEGVKEELVLSPGHALSFIAAGEEHRHVGSNNFNLFSSRSHTIFTLMIESSARGDEYDGVIFSQLNLIDLAGSESSKTETTGLRRKEGSYINKSLLTLGTVIGKLSEGKSSHVPYRDSKLTRLLQSSLTGRGHVSLICTVTPASSNLEETHNTLKFASRAKRIEIFASRNKIIDEKSLIKKYQKEISTLKEELDHLKKGMVGVSHEEIINLRQKLEEGQVKMQSRLEEEEEAKAALMSRIQRLTKLILVSTKNAVPALTDVEVNKENLPTSAIDKQNGANDSTLILESENFDNFLSCSSISSDPQSSLNKESIRIRTETAPAIDPDGTATGGIYKDQVDLIVEQVKMLAGEVAFATSTLKRLVEQSVNDPQSSKEQIQNLEREIQEKKKQMKVLEERLRESGEASIAKPSLDEMQQTVTKLMTQCNEKSFELEIKAADNRVLQEQLQNKCIENQELREKLKQMEKQLVSLSGNEVTSSKEIQNERIRKQLREENKELRVQNERLAKEASYAKELASAAAVELKTLAGEVTRLSLQSSKLEKDLVTQKKTGRKGKLSGRNPESEVEGWDQDPHDIKMELVGRRQREAALEIALAEKESVIDEYRRKAEEAKKREEFLESDLANMWILVAQLKKSDRANSNFGYASLGHDINDGTATANATGTVLVNGFSHVCKVCFESPTSAILLPCRHFCLCKSCSMACSECPICRTTIIDRLFAFAS